MNRLVLAAAIAAPLAITGCMSAGELRARDEQTCRDYGFRKRNDAFAECLQRLDLDRRARVRANETALYEMERDFWRERYYHRPRFRNPRPHRPQ